MRIGPLLLALLIGAAGAAHAGEPEDLDMLVLRAHAALDAGEAAQAAALLEEAYARRPVPELLFHLGEAHRRLPGGTARALRYFRRYLSEERQPSPALQRRAAEAIAELSAQLAEERERAGAQGPGRAPAVRGVPAAPDLGVPAPPTAPDQTQVLSMNTGVPASRPAQAPRRPHVRRAALGLLGGGALLGAVGGLLLSQSIAAAGAAREADSFTAHLDEHDRAHRLLGGGGACLAAAGAAALAGGSLLLFHYTRERRGGPEAGRAAALIAPGGLALAWAAGVP